MSEGAHNKRLERLEPMIGKKAVMLPMLTEDIELVVPTNQELMKLMMPPHRESMVGRGRWVGALLCPPQNPKQLNAWTLTSRINGPVGSINWIAGSGTSENVAGGWRSAPMKLLLHPEQNSSSAYTLFREGVKLAGVPQRTLSYEKLEKALSRLMRRIPSQWNLSERTH